jgi:hypothetical protein
VRLSVHCWVVMLVLCEGDLMAVLAMPHKDAVVELDAGDFSFLMHEVLWQEAGFTKKCWYPPGVLTVVWEVYQQ